MNLSYFKDMFKMFTCQIFLFIYVFLVDHCSRVRPGGLVTVTPVAWWCSAA